jgi:hypothetical protein
MEGHGEVGFGKELATVDRQFNELPFECSARKGSAGNARERTGSVRSGKDRNGEARRGLAWNWKQSIGYWQQYHFECL